MPTQHFLKHIYPFPFCPAIILLYLFADYNQVEFDWATYLQEVSAEPVPYDFFTNVNTVLSASTLLCTCISFLLL